MDKDKELLRKLYSAVVKYFNAENGFRRKPDEKTWEAKKEADRVLTVTVAEIREYLKRK
jgi:hypothetical protein